MDYTNSPRHNPIRKLGRTIVWISVGCAFASRAVVPAAAVAGPTDRVRSTDPAILGLLEEGSERSATFRALVDAIEHSTGIVYVEFGYCAFGHLDGCMLPFIAPAQGDRYLRVIVAPNKNRKSRDQLLALIGHELRHALEVIEHPEVVDAATMDAMYRKIGIPLSGGLKGYETSAARATGDAVLADLIRKARPVQEFRIATARVLPSLK